MSQISSSSSFHTIFGAALQDYENRTGIRLVNHPFAKQLEECDSLDSINAIVLEQAKGFREFKRDNGKLMKLLKCSVDVLHTLSTCTVLGEVVGVPFPPAKAIFTGIAILLRAVKSRRASYDTLVELFTSFKNFLGRLSIYTGIPPTPVLTDLLVKIIAELLYTLALATKHVKRGRLKKFVKNVCGKNEIDAALRRLDRLTSDEGRAIAAQTLEVVYGLVQHRRVVLDDADGNGNNSASPASISRVLDSTQEIVSESELKKEQRRLYLIPNNRIDEGTLARADPSTALHVNFFF